MVAYSSDARGELNAPARELIIHPHKKPPKAISHPQETAEDFPKNPGKPHKQRFSGTS